MIVRVGMAPRRRGMSTAEFQEHWRTTHADAALLIPGLERYVQNHAVVTDGRYVLPYPGFDACAETEFASVEVMDAGFASSEYRETVQVDEHALIDRAAFFCALTEREVLLDGPSPKGAVKLITLVRVHPIAERSAVLDALRGEYASAVAAADGPRRHELLVTSPEAHRGRYRMACDAIDEVWFDTPGAAFEFVTGAAGIAAWIHLAGLALGTERLVARPIRVK
ncbi:MAG: EthD domain-containing protein [Acidimicrobiales bacterium]